MNVMRIHEYALTEDVKTQLVRTNASASLVILFLRMEPSAVILMSAHNSTPAKTADASTWTGHISAYVMPASSSAQMERDVWVGLKLC